MSGKEAALWMPAMTRPGTPRCSPRSGNGPWRDIPVLTVAGSSLPEPAGLGEPDSPAGSGGTTAPSAGPICATAAASCFPRQSASLPGRPGSQPPPSPASTRSWTFCVTYNENGFWSLYTQSREPGRRWPDAAAPLGGHLGPADRQLSGFISALFPAPQRLEENAC